MIAAVESPPEVGSAPSSERMQTPVWHQLQINDAVALLRTDLSNGLTTTEAKHRRRVYGPNKLTTKRGTPAWRRFLFQFHQPLVYVLLAATAVSAYFGEHVDAAVIFAVTVVNALVGFFQETKAEKAINALANMIVPEANVRRDGRKQRVPTMELVPGDIVLLESGDRVPADLRLFQVRGLQIDEAPLTGESQAVNKHTAPLAFDTALGDRKSLAYAGTAVTSGRGEGVVWATGDKTEMGRIAWLITEATEVTTPLTRKIAHFSRILLWVILAFALIMIAVGLWHGGKLIDMFMAAVALSVGAIPEGLPAAITATLAIGVSRMARRRAIIRKLPAVETLGSTTVICSDKTGTLTRNEMTVREIFAGGLTYEISGVGYGASGGITHGGGSISAMDQPALLACLRAGLLCNDALVTRRGEDVQIQGDPTEAALLVAAEKAGLVSSDHHRDMPRLDSIPFESEHQFMATLHGSGHGPVIYKKGAAERLLEKCSTMLDRAGNELPIDRGEISEAVERMAAKGLRVLAFARREMPDGVRGLEHEHVARGLTFLGLQGMIDPPRPEAIESLRRCQTAGISVKMITGDHLLTAQAIAQQIGLRGRAIGGRELAAINQSELPQIAEEAAVFARVTPEQKLRLVQALQARSHVVAMTGDGVNDAPALKQADIGIAMGINGTDVAKGAADMVLTDDNFASIEAAVEEGRAVFDNLVKFIVWTLPTSCGAALVLLTAILLGRPLPALPVQLLWINLTTALLLGIALVFEPKERDLMDRPPRNPHAPILTLSLILRIALVSLLMLVGAVAMFQWEQTREGAGLAEARTVVVNVIVVASAFYLLSCRSLTRSIWSVGVFSNPWVLLGLAGMIAAQIAFTHLPLMNRLFHSAPIELEAWMRIAAVSVGVSLAVGFEKWLRFGRKSPSRSQ
jgi:cation-transporting ATPase F